MMKRVYLFNPENDMALAANVDRYTAPPRIRALRDNLAILPMWIAEPGSRIIAPDGDASLIEKYIKHLDALDDIDIYGGQQMKPTPWGWSRPVRHEFERLGLDCDADDVLMEKLKYLSNRETSIELLKRLDAKGIDTPLLPRMCFSVAEAKDAVHSFGDAVLKMPWSSSGRGIVRIADGDFRVYENWTAGAVRRQGSVVCEAYLDKVQDFAMEYRARCGKVEFCGYSVFFNDKRLSYDHALVATTGRLRRCLLEYMDASTLDRLQTAVAQSLSELIPEAYDGYVGVDMMVYRKPDGSMAVNPCVEMNLRTTMGVVSACLGDRVLQPGLEGVMQVLYHKDTDALSDFMASVRPPLFDGGYLVGGTLLLAPVCLSSSYTATLTVV